MVLLVEDDRADAEMVLRMLKSTASLPCELRVVRTLAEAVEALCTQPADIVLLDLGLPDSQGLEALHRVQERCPHTPIVILTGLEDEQLILRAAAAGAQDYLVKGRIYPHLLIRSIRYAVHRKSTEDALRASEALYREFLENAMDLVQCVGPDGRYLYVNRTWRETLGYSADEVTALTVAEVVHPDDLEHCRRTIDEVLEGTDVPHLQARFRTKEGQTVYVEGSVNCQMEHGQPVATRAIFHNVTARRAAETSLQQTRETIEAMLTALPDIVVRIAADGRVLDVHVPDHLLDAAQPQEAYLGRDVFEIAGERLGSGQAAIVRSAVQTALATQSLQRFEYRDELAGRVRDMEARLVPCRNGEVLAIIRDITEAKQAEEHLQRSEWKFRTLAETVDAAIFIYQGDRLVYANTAACRITGYSMKELLQMNSWEVVDPEMQPLIRTRRDLRLQGRPTPAHYEVKIRRKDGGTVWVDYRAALIDFDGNVAVLGTGFDISERKRAEEQLRLRELQYKILYENIPVMYFTLDESGLVQSVNHYGVEHLGYAAEDVVGKPVTEVFHPDDREQVAAQLRSCLQRPGEVAHWEFRKIKKDGSVIWVEEAVRAVPQPDGSTMVLVACEDTSEQKRTRLALQESEEKYRSLIENVNIGIYRNTLELPGRFLQANLALAHILGFESVEELMGASVAELYANPEERTGFVEKLRSTGAVRNEEITLRHRQSGRLIHASVTARVHADRSGRMLWADGVLEDITTQKQIRTALEDSERKYRQLVELLQEGIWVIDADARTTFVNPRMAEMLGYRADEMIGRHLFDFMDEEGVAVCREKLKRRHEGVTESHDFRFIRKDGGAVYASLGTGPVFDREGRYIGAIAGVSDITERRRVEEERSWLATRLLDLQEEERRAISATLHDELGQLLTLARMDLDSTEGGSLPASQRQSALRRIDEALKSVRHLALSLRPPLLDDLGIKTALETLAEEFSAGSHLPVAFSVVGELAISAKDQETCLYRVLQEALTNVAKHAAATRIDVRLECTPESVTLHVLDNGTGVAESELRSPRGTGLIGMRERLTRLGGSLRVERPAAGGTHLLALLPLQPPAHREAK